MTPSPVVAGLGGLLRPEQRHDLADEALERLDVVRRRLLGDERAEADLRVWPQPVGELLRGPDPERRVVRDSAQWLPSLTSDMVIGPPGGSVEPGV